MVKVLKTTVLLHRQLPTGEWVAAFSFDGGPIRELPGTFPTEAAVCRAIDQLALQMDLTELPAVRPEDLN